MAVLLFNSMHRRRVLSPEYGGDGVMIGDCDKYALPIATFPAHSSPSGIVVDRQNLLRNKNPGAYISFLGGWGRQPFTQTGYFIVYVPFKDGRPLGTWETFADGFAGSSSVRTSERRPLPPIRGRIGPRRAPIHIGAEGRPNLEGVASVRAQCNCDVRVRDRGANVNR